MTDGGVWKLDTKSGAWTEITPGEARRQERSVRMGRGLGGRAQSQGGHRQHFWPHEQRRRRGRDVPHHRRRQDLESGIRKRRFDLKLAPFANGSPSKPVLSDHFGPFDYTLAPYTATTPIHWMFDIEIDPSDPKHAMFTTGYGGWETFNLTDLDAGKPTRWSIMATGIEQTAALEMASPTKGAHLLSAMGTTAGSCIGTSTSRRRKGPPARRCSTTPAGSPAARTSPR